MNSEFQTIVTPSLFSTGRWDPAAYATLGAEDIRHPGKSVYGFSANAARLAANQPLILHCREDEVFDLLAKLNDLLGNLAILNEAYWQLAELKENTERKLARLTDLETQPIEEAEISEIVKTIETYLTTDNSSQTVLDRLEQILTPSRSFDETDGLKTMLDRLEETMAALAAVKDRGFRVAVLNRRRQPHRPALAARRNRPIMHNGQPTDLNAGFLLPDSYHLTLWAYQIKRNEQGQSAIWN
jgi:hypothetical protein